MSSYENADNFAGYPESFFAVSEQATHGLSLEVRANIEAGIWPAVLYEDLAIDDETLDEALEIIAVGSHLDFTGAENFRDGAAASHRLLCFQAELDNVELPRVGAVSVDGLCNQLETNWESPYAYLQDRLDHLALHNSNFLTAQIEYLESASGVQDIRSAYDYLLGAVAVFDLLLQQQLFDEMCNDYANSIH